MLNRMLALRPGGQYVDAGSYDPDSPAGILLQKAEVRRLAREGYTQFVFVDDAFDLDDVLGLLKLQLEECQQEASE